MAWERGIITIIAATLENLARIFKRLSLGHLTDYFSTRQNTPDMFSMLSTHETNQLGIRDYQQGRHDELTLGVSHTYGRQKPGKQRAGYGAPEFDIPRRRNYFLQNFIRKPICFKNQRIQQHLILCKNEVTACKFLLVNKVQPWLFQL